MRINVRDRVRRNIHCNLFNKFCFFLIKLTVLAEQRKIDFFRSCRFIFGVFVPCLFIRERNRSLFELRLCDGRLGGKCQLFTVNRTAGFTSFDGIIRDSPFRCTVYVLVRQTVDRAFYTVAVCRERNNEYAFVRDIACNVTGIIIVYDLCSVFVHALHRQFQRIAVYILFDDMVTVTLIDNHNIHILTRCLTDRMIGRCVERKGQLSGGRLIG